MRPLRNRRGGRLDQLGHELTIDDVETRRSEEIIPINGS